MGEQVLRKDAIDGAVLRLPGADFRLTAEQALRAVIDNQVFAALRDLEPLDGGRAVQAVYIALIRRLPNVIPDRKRIAIDTGFSESSVKRAIKLLELCRLVSVERQPGSSSVYHLTDIRSVEIASECVAAIRKALRSQGRVTSEPGDSESRSTSEPSSRARSGREVGSLVPRKEAMKIQTKQQSAVADDVGELNDVLKRWGLLSARYLVTPGHKQAIPALTGNARLAATRIDKAMKQASWSADSGVGSKVAFLREHVSDVQAMCDRDSAALHKKRVQAFARARGVAASLPDISPAALDPEQSAMLLERGLRRLAEPDDVSRLLRANAAAAERIVAHELLRDSIAESVAAMNDIEFLGARESLFVAEPALKKLYGDANRESRGLCLCLIEHLRLKALSRPQASFAPRRALSNSAVLEPTR